MRARLSFIGAGCLLAVLVLLALRQVSVTSELPSRATEDSQDRESPPAGQPQPGEDRAVRVENERVDVAFEGSKEAGRNCTARVRISYRLRNRTDEPHPAEQRLPVVAPRAENAPRGWLEVRVDGQPVEVTTQPLVEPPARPRARRQTKERREAWVRLIDQWSHHDPELRDMLSRHEELISARDELTRLSGAFQAEVAEHLIHVEDCRYVACYVAQGKASLWNLVRLMPEVDPSLRFDIEYKRWKYVSYLTDYDCESYGPYEDEWARKADAWIQSKPKLAALAALLRPAWRSFSQAQQLLHGPIAKHLHDQCGLSLRITLQLVGYYDWRISSPPVDVVRTLFADVRRELDAAAEQEARLLKRWGFDGPRLSPYTGRPYCPARDDFSQRLTGWRDSTVLAALGGPAGAEEAPARLPVAADFRSLGWPSLITFEVPLEPRGEASVVVQYEVKVRPMEDPRSSMPLMHFRAPQLSCVLRPGPKRTPAEARVSVPAGLHPILSPEPQSATVEDDGRRRFQTTVSPSRENLHVLLVDFRGRFGTSGYAERFRVDARTRRDLEKLLEGTTNRTLRPLLTSALCRVLQGLGQQYDTYRLHRQLEQEHPDFAGIRAPGQNDWATRQAKTLYEWIEATGRRPGFPGRDDLDRFHRYCQNPHTLRALAEEVQALDDADLSLEERMGRRFVLCQAGIEREKNLVELLGLADSEPEAVLPALRFLRSMSVEKPEALPFVLKHVNVGLRDRRAPGSDPEWRRRDAALHTLGTFRSPATAEPIIALIRSTDDFEVTHQAVNALRHMTLPERFDVLAGVADRAARAFDRPSLPFLDLLVRSDPDRAVDVLRRLRGKYPEYAPWIMVSLARAGDSLVLPDAVEIYRTSDDKETLSTAVQTIETLAQPADLARLEYRSGLPKWMNERLLGAIESTGAGKDAYPFVERFYHEFVEDKPAHNHLPCVRAFEAIGDKRAIPYLEETIRITERKSDAAQAIGNLILDRRVKRPPPPPIDLARLAEVTVDPRRTPEERAEAWKQLLEDPDASMQQIVARGPVHRVLEPGDSSWHRWRPEHDDRLAFLARFGDVAARHLLDAGRGCSLIDRYQLAHMLTLLPEESNERLRATASDPAADADQRRTAILALGMRRDRTSARRLGSLLDEEALSVNVIDALGRIGGPVALSELKSLKRRLETGKAAGFRQSVKLSKIDTALSGSQEQKPY